MGLSIFFPMLFVHQKWIWIILNWTLGDMKVNKLGKTGLLPTGYVVIMNKQRLYIAWQKESV